MLLSKCCLNVGFKIEATTSLPTRMVTRVKAVPLLVIRGRDRAER